MKRLSSLLFILSGCLFSYVPATAQVAAVELMVKLPGTGIQKDSSVFLAGSFNNWNPGDSSYMMHRIDKTHYRLVIPCFKGKKYAYKYTLGSWSKVEKGNDGKNISNRTFIARNRMKIKDVILQWNHPEPVAPKDTSNMLTKAQLAKMSALKDSVMKSLAPAIPQLLSLLKQINTNLLANQPDTTLERQYNQKVTVIVSHALDTLTDGIRQMTDLLTPEQKQKIKETMQDPNAPKDLVNLIMQSLNQK
ncbi:Spy/CpxP family protein refolding chaperone [Microbacter margulisiae]|uniref:CBM20 domain-containing protein n=1 Tax=Microbacter margulisiae TaxID=1350067 RepID=A0A7W5H1G9_9PORP|nr:Spy/CpxP family protein refolding chaperone [Microbacter margulisiae]MBB3186351.1 hypothetical protein [Microbacter margulisiae]